MNRILPLFCVFFLMAGAASAQDITTAADFFAQMQAKYGSAPDYEAAVSIQAGRSTMSGDLAYKAPNLLRIDFSQPANQVICFDGQMLTVYLPEYNAVLQQATQDTASAGAGLASAQGLQLLKRNFSIAYESSPSPVPLEDGSAEQVIKLKLDARVGSEGYRRVVLSVNPDTKIIRRMDGTTTDGSHFVFTFSNVRFGLGIASARFEYDPPASANLYNNFLFKTE